MKVTRSFALSFALAMMLPVMVFAKDKPNQAKVDVPEAVQVGSTVLQPGTYKVEWSGTGDNVQVNFLQHNKTAATAQAMSIENKSVSPYTDVVTENGPNNQKQLVEIDFSNSKQALKLTSGSGTSTPAGQP
jgi:hypothetical protein